MGQDLRFKGVAMTQISTDPTAIRWPAFIAALILAPLILGVPAWALFALFIKSNADMQGVFNWVVAFTAYSIPFGAPTYLTFGAFFFWRALWHNQSMIIAGLCANLVSIIVVAAGLFLFSAGHDLGSILLMFLVFGSVYSMIWGWFFGLLYHRFTKSKTA